MDALSVWLEASILRSGALAAALVAVGVVLRWLWVKVHGSYVESVKDIIEANTKQLRPNGGSHVADLPKKVDEFILEVRESGVERDQRIANIEGQMSVVIGLLRGQDNRALIVSGVA